MVVLTLEYIKHATGEFDPETTFQAILSNRSIQRIDAVGLCTNLRWLDLSNNQIVRIENLSNLVQLSSLDLSFNKIHKVENLDGMRSLERLQIKSNPISRLQDVEGLRPASKLRHLLFQNIDKTDFCPVCLQPDYQKTIFEVCPDLVALDSRRRHLPDLDKEVQRLEKQPELVVPEMKPWFTAEDLSLDGIHSSTKLADVMQPHVEDFEAALKSCQAVLKEAEELLKAQEIAPTTEASS